MMLVFMLLLALSTPTHTFTATATPAPGRQTLTVESRVAAAERDTATWTKGLAIGTFVLAFVTLIAVFSPSYFDALRREDEVIAAARLLWRTLATFNRRMDQLANDPNWSAKTLLIGLDIPLAQALSQDVWRALPATALSLKIYIALMRAQDTLVLSVGWQQAGGGQNICRAQTEAQTSCRELRHVTSEVAKYVRRLERNRSWFSPIAAAWQRVFTHSKPFSLERTNEVDNGEESGVAPGQEVEQ
jgi:hypothetical protein